MQQGAEICKRIQQYDKNEKLRLVHNRDPGYTNTSISCLDPYLKIEKIHNIPHFVPPKPRPSYGAESPFQMMRRNKEENDSESEENLFGTRTGET